MKRLIAIATVLILSSCGGSLMKNDVFTGDWVMSKSSPSYSGEAKSMTIKITKEDIFYKVNFILNGKSVFDEMGKDDNKMTNEIKDNFMKYQLSPDKKFLVNIMTPEYVIMYNEDSKTITTPFGWFKKE